MKFSLSIIGSWIVACSLGYHETADLQLLIVFDQLYKKKTSLQLSSFMAQLCTSTNSAWEGHRRALSFDSSRAAAGLLSRSSSFSFRIQNRVVGEVGFPTLLIGDDLVYTWR